MICGIHMASPQTEDGHTRIAHELMGAILKARLSAPQMAIVFFVIRMSYGWGRKEAERPRIREIAEQCGGIPRATVSHAIRGLLGRKILTQIDGGFWAVNKDYETWVLANPLAKVTPKPANPLAKKSNPLAKSANPLATLHIVKKKEKRKGEPTDIQAIVEAYKTAKKIDPANKAWDRANFARRAKAAKALLDSTGAVENAISYLQARGQYLSAKNLEWTLETIAKNAADKAPVEEVKKSADAPNPYLGWRIER